MFKYLSLQILTLFNKKTSGFLFLLFLFQFAHPQQYDSIKHSLVERILFLQNHGDGNSVTCLLPSYIKCSKHARKARPDNNIYFNAITSYILNRSIPCLEKQDQLTAIQISEQSRLLYPHFQNISGRPTYNFWRTDTTFNIPYSKVVRLISNDLSLPDDFDDTSMILMAMNAPDSTVNKVHAIMQSFTNNPKKKVRGTSAEYRHMQAYSCWFGKDFPVLFDVCVSANVLTLVSEYNIAWTKADSATLDFILRVIQNRDYIRKPLTVAPYYGNTSLIIYHLARLISVSKEAKLIALKDNLVREALNELKKDKSLTEQVILNTSLIRLGYQDKEIQLPGSENLVNEIETSPLPFFIGNMPSFLPNIFKIPLTSLGLFIYYHYCPAYNDALLLEYITLRQSMH
jgi:hypothetical protein